MSCPTHSQDQLGQLPPAERWQDLRSALLYEWVELKQTLEHTLQETSQRQELLLNQYGAGVCLSRVASPDPFPTIWRDDEPEHTQLRRLPEQKLLPTTFRDECKTPCEDLHIQEEMKSWCRGGAGPDRNEQILSMTTSQGSLGAEITQTMTTGSEAKSTRLSTGLSTAGLGVDGLVAQLKALATSTEDALHHHTSDLVKRVLKAPDALSPLQSSTSSTPRKFEVKTWDGLDADTYEHRRMVAMRVWEVRKVVGERLWGLLGRHIVWWLELQVPVEASGPVGTCVTSQGFSLLSALVLLLNCITIVMSTNAEAETGRRSQFMHYCNLGFVSFYLLELVLRLIVHRWWYFCNNEMAWNWFDFWLVLLALVDTVVQATTLDSSFRILRMSRILRMVRVLRRFPKLRLMLESLVGSIVSLSCSLVMMMSLFAMFATEFVQATTAVLQDEDSPITMDQRLKLEEDFGQIWAAMVTLFKATTGGDDWGQFYKTISLTGDFNSALFLFFIAFAQFTLLNIIMGMFVVNAMSLSKPDKETIALDQRKADMKQASEFRSLCQTMDRDSSGCITEEEFLKAFKDDQFRARLSLLDLDIKKAKPFFDMVCQDIPEKIIPIELFVSRAMRLKGVATCLDLETLMFGAHVIHENQLQFHYALEATLDRVLICLESNSNS